MSRILILTNFSGGLYDFRNEFVEALLAEHEVFISLPDDVKTKELRAEGAKIIQTPINRRGVNPVEDLKLCWRYCNIIKKIRPDLVVTYTIKPNIYGGFCARVLKVSYIATITGLGGAFDRKGLFLQLIIRMYRAGLRGAECVFFQNRENREIFRNFRIMVKKDRLVMGSGVNLKRHCYEPYPKGDEDYQEMLDGLESKGIIHQLGFHTEVHPYLTKASAIVVASYHEGMSNALIEAAATGRPVIASNISGCKEAFEEGRTGFGFTPGNSEELIEAMEKFLELPYEKRSEMGQAGRRKMEEEFNRELVTAAYMEEVHRILADKADK